MLVDTNVIIESHRVGVWKALAGGYRVETVEDRVTETQTGFQWLTAGGVHSRRGAQGDAIGRICGRRPGAGRTGGSDRGYRVGQGRGVALGARAGPG